MSLLFRCDSLAKSFGSRQLFSGISLSFDDTDRIGFIGPNGSGKSTLLKIMAGLEQPDAGELISRRNLKLGYVAQTDEFAPGATVHQAMVDAFDDAPLEAHDRDARIASLLTRVGFEDFDKPAATLSGGWRKRLAVARQLVREPDALLLDEPTNHLDLDGILWLEKVLSGAPFAFVLVSHDRYFLENVTNRTVELNAAFPDGYLSINGKYSEFLVKKEEFLAAQASLEQSVASRVRREIEWLHRGAKARTTKAKGRIQQAGRLMDELDDLRTRNNQTQAVALDFVGTNRQTRKLIAVDRVSKTLGGKKLFNDVTFTLAPLMRLGLVGPNGAGKSTLIQLLAGRIEPDTGTIRRADQLKVVLFDQARATLDPNQTLAQALSPGGETIVFRGQSMHISGWARRFLFRTQQLTMPISDLSGGEQSRVLIANIMREPADVLILDEPTNDLDIPSLEVLEEALTDFPGALVLVTHDRYLLDSLATDILGLDGNGDARLFGDYTQYEEALKQSRRTRSDADKAAAKLPAGRSPNPSAKPLADKPRKLSYMEQREWDQIEDKIIALEADLDEKQKRLGDPKILADHVKLKEASQQAAAAQTAVDAIYRRWEDLAAKREE